MNGSDLPTSLTAIDLGCLYHHRALGSSVSPVMMKISLKLEERVLLLGRPNLHAGRIRKASGYTRYPQRLHSVALAAMLGTGISTTRSRSLNLSRRCWPEPSAQHGFWTSSVVRPSDPDRYPSRLHGSGPLTRLHSVSAN